MALGAKAISYVNGNIVNLETSKATIDDCINTISYVKNNNDLTMWADDTAIGSKWSENVNKLIDATNRINNQGLTDLISKTRSFLENQEATNKNGQ